MEERMSRYGVILQRRMRGKQRSIFLPAEHGVLGGVHAADFGAVGLALFAAVTAGAHALDEHDGAGVFSVGGAKQRAAGGACRVHQTLEFQTGHHIRALSIGELIEFTQINGIEAGGGHDGAVFLLNQLVLLMVSWRLFTLWLPPSWSQTASFAAWAKCGSS